MAKKLYTQNAYGYPGPVEALFPRPIISQRAPTTLDTGHAQGQVWVDETTDVIYQLSQNTGGLAVWVVLGGGRATSGTGYPTFAAAPGSIFIRTDGAYNDSVLYVNYDGAAGHWRPVLRENSTWIEHFTQSPVMQSAVNTGAAPTGATGDVNLMCLQGGEIMQQFILGAGQTIIAPRMDAAGLLVSLDLTNNEGAEYNWGVTPVSKHAYTIHTSAPFAMIMSFRVADVTGAGPILMGFRKQEANNAAFAAYTDFATIGLDNAINPGTVIIETRLNSGAVTTTNTTNAWVDGANHTLRIDVTHAGVVSFGIDGLAPVVTQAFTFDAGDIVMPFFHFLHDAVAPGAIEWTDMAVGLI